MRSGGSKSGPSTSRMGRFLIIKQPTSLASVLHKISQIEANMKAIDGARKRRDQGVIRYHIFPSVMTFWKPGQVYLNDTYCLVLSPFSFFSFSPSPLFRVSLCSPGCSKTHSVDQVGLEFRDLPASAPECWD